VQGTPVDAEYVGRPFLVPDERLLGMQGQGLEMQRERLLLAGLVH
jgi:hypothetical protein